jgi:uroporphyrinogen decarboxylase
MMNGTQRLAAAMAGTPADRVPVFCNLLDQGARELGMPIREYYARGENVAHAQLQMRQRYGHDNVWSLFYVAREAQLLGCNKIVFAQDGPPNVGEMVIKRLEDIDRLVVPTDILSHPAFQEELKCLKILRAEVGGKYPICAYVTGSMALPAMLMGMEKWMHLLLMGPAQARDQLLEKCSQFFRQEIAAYRQAGADVLLYSNPFGSTDFVTRRLFDTLVVPWMKRDLEEGGTAGVVYYCGSARFNDVIGDIREKLGISAFYLSPLDDIAEGKRRVGPDGLTCGVINDIPLIDSSPEEVRRAVKRVMDAGKAGGKFLFGNVVMPYAIPEENIRALVDTACELGRWEDP